MTKASQGLEIHEELIFKRTNHQQTAVDFFNHHEESAAITANDIDNALGGERRKNSEELLLPELGELDAVRHFTRLSKKNFSIDVSSYPLGSCTMKYNPKIHEWVARLPGFTALHPYLPDHLTQHALKICFELQNFLSEIAGFIQTSLAPSAGAHGEFAGLAMIKKALADRGETRKKILVPMSAHGTNPATAAFFSYDIVALEVGDDGRMSIAAVEKLMDDDCAGLMVTNPNTLGIFETDQAAISRIVHARGGYVYGDGANLNAMMGITRPGDLGIDVMHFNLHKTMTTPHGGGGPGCGAVGAAPSLAKYLPLPMITERDGQFSVVTDNDSSIGRIRSFYGNFGMMLRAWTYVRSLGADGLKRASELAVLNANYVRARLHDHYHVAYKADCLHEVVLSDAMQVPHNVTALDIAKRLLDYGIHPPTMYFPLVVKGALMVEPTETESLYDLDRMIDAFIAIADEAKSNPELVKSAPHNTALSRLDEAKAARKPVLTYQESLLS